MAKGAGQSKVSRLGTNSATVCNTGVKDFVGSNPTLPIKMLTAILYSYAARIKSILYPLKVNKTLTAKSKIISHTFSILKVSWKGEKYVY